MNRAKTLACTVATVFMIATLLGGCGNTSKTTEATTADIATETAPTTTETVLETSETSESTTVEPSEETTAPFVRQDGQTTLTYIGHASVKIVSANGTAIYIDPAWTDGDYSDPADILLITHNHDDHMPIDDLIRSEDCQTISWAEAHHDDVYETFTIDDITIEAVPAGNANHPLESCVGYIVTVDGIKIYHAGDTSKLDTMSELAEKDIDYAMYPIDGTYNMGSSEATEVANIVGAEYNIPIHELSNMETKRERFQPDGRMILEYGETIVIREAE